MPKLLRITDVQQNSVDWEAVPLCEDEPPARSLLRNGDIVIARTGATTGKSYLISSIPEDTAFASYLIRVRSAEGVLPDYLATFMRTADYWSQITTVSKGTAQPGANAAVLGELRVPLAPLPEQRRIVAKLDRLSARSAAARDHLARTAKLAARAKQAILVAAFQSVDENAAEHRALADICRRADPIIYGILQPGPNLPDGVPYVRPTEMEPRGIALEKLRRTSAEISARYSRSTLRSGDILLSIVGTIGKVAVVPEALEGGNITQSSCRIRITHPEVEPSWIVYFLRSPLAVAQYDERRLGTAVPRLNLADVRKFIVPCPERHVQVARIMQIEAAFARIDRMTAEAALAAHLLDRLDQRLLARAFRGELVPQDPADEPAEALLARIRAARADAPKPRRGRRARPA